MNDPVNGSANGGLATDEKKPVRKVTAPRTRRKGRWLSGSWWISTIFRIWLWYTAFSILFRCPSSPSDLTEQSPVVCKHYLRGRDIIAPHLQPHYNSHIKPYVDQARPYIDRFNENVYTPASAFTKEKYAIYGAPRVQQLQELAEEQWKTTIKPQTDACQSWAQQQYDKVLAPYVKQVYDAGQPYVNKAKEGIEETYESTLLPAYEYVYPYLQHAYAQGHYYTAHVILPYLHRAETSALSFLNRKLWPQLVILYGENVEPQLMRITERLGRYKDGKKLEAAVEEMDSASSSVSASSKVSSTASSISSSMLSSANSAAPLTPSGTPSPEPTPESEEDVRAKIESDLKRWQEKFAKAADRGAEDLQERVKEITARQIESQPHSVGKALLVRLEEKAASEIAGLKAKINKIVKALPENASETDEASAQDKAVSSIRTAGSVIRENAQAVRTWKQKYDNETFSLVAAALDSTLDVVDSIRDLGLQEIGMRWAWMEGVTYKDWSKYHALKKTFDEWRDKVEAAALEHEGLKKAKDEGELVQEQAMEIAEKAAKELSRLKSVAAWKIAVRDSSDDFETKVLPPKPVKAAQEVIGKVKEAVSPSSHGTVESVSSEASKSVEDVASSVSNFVAVESSRTQESAEYASPQASEALTHTHPKAESATSAASSQMSEVSADASEPVKSAAGTVISAPKYKAEQAREKIKGTPGPSSESVLSIASEMIDSLNSAASDAVPIEGASKSIESLSSAASEAIPSEAAENVKRVWAGAAAVHVEAKQIVLDNNFLDTDDESYSSRLKSMVDAAGDKAAELTSAISEAFNRPTSTQGAVESATSIASEQYLRAMSAASNILYGTESGAFESLPSAASERYEQAVTAASWAIYGTPTPVLQSLSAKASSRYDEAISAAKDRYSAAMSKASVTVSGTPKPAYESVLSSIEEAYSGSISAASAQLHSALGYTNSISSFWARPTQGVFDSISSVASSRLQEGLSQASAQYTSAKIAVSAQPSPLHQQYLAEAQRKYYEGIGLAHDRYSRFVEAASSVVYGTPTPAYQSWAHKASEAMYGTPAPAYESLLSAASSRYDKAVSAASKQLYEIRESASSIAGLSSTPVPQSILDAARSSYTSAAAAASEALVAASSSASIAVYGTPAPAYESLLSVARGQYSAAVDSASSKYDELLRAASSAVGKTSKSPAQSALDSLSSSYNEAVSSASEVLAAASASASSVLYGTSTGTFESLASIASGQLLGTETPWLESMAAKAAENWEGLISKASEQVYGEPTPFTKSVWSQAGEYAAQATVAAASQYAALQAIISDLVVGKEPDFTESVMSRLSSVYYTGAPGMASQASSYASDQYASASSVMTSVFTTPPTVEAMLESLTEQLNAAVDAVSMQIYGSEPGTVEKATSAAASMYSDATSKASDAVYGTQPNFAQQAQSSFSDVHASVSSAISAAIYGTPTGTVEAMTSGAANVYSSISSVAAEHMKAAGDDVEDTYSGMSARVSEAVYGPQQGAWESAQSRVAAAMESAMSRIAEMQSNAPSGASSVASSVSSAASSVISSVRDEL